MKERLNKVLAQAGYASRRKADELIQRGFVTVNGVVEIKPQIQVDPQNDQIVVKGTLLEKPETKVYFALNKPRGYLCSNARLTPTTRLAIDLLGHLPYRLYTIGRLDKPSCGLIIVTNDGAFAQKVAHPSYDVEKEYLVKVAAFITDNHLKKIAEGRRIEGCFVKPTSVKKVRRGTLKIVVKEGKKHEVRLLCKNADLKVLELKRIRIGNLKLGNLPIGAHKALSLKERDALLHTK